MAQHAGRAVYDAFDCKDGARVVLKEAAGEFPPGDLDWRKRFDEWVSDIMTLQHRGLARVNRYFAEGERHYLITERVEGQPLDRAVPEAQALAWGRQMVEALGAIHPLVFAVLQPSHVIVTADGNLKLINFGFIDRLRSSSFSRLPGSVSAGVLPAGLIAGSAVDEYSFPNSFGATGLVTGPPQHDFYSVGATLHFLLTGAPPPRAVDRIIRAAPLRLRELAPDVSPSTEALVRRLMTLQPKEMFADAAEVLASLP